MLVAGAAVGVLAGAAAALRAGAPERLELALYDARAAAAARGDPASPGVVMVAIDEPTVRLAGGVHPLPRGALAAILEEARAAGARVIAVDYLLEDPLEGALADENAALEQAIAGGGVVLAAAIPPAPPEPLPASDERGQQVRRRHARPLGGAGRPERFVLSPPLTRFALAAAALGGVSQQLAANGRVYSLRHVYPAAEGDYPSLPLAAARLARQSPEARLERGRLRLGDASIPAEADGTSYVRWYGPYDGRAGGASTYPELSAAVLLQARLAREGAAAAPPAATLDQLRGRVVVVCQTLAGTKDKQPTPVNETAVGGEVLANAIDNLLRGEGMRRLPAWAEAALTVALALATALLVALASARALRPWVLAAVSAAAAGAVLAAWWALSIAGLRHGLWLPALCPMGGAALAAFAADLRLLGLERRDRRFVHDALGRYTSPALVETLLARRELLDRFGGSRQDLTVYFSDIRGFTSFSEGMEPERLVELLNAYLSELTEVIERHGGYVDKYIGDAIMAIWGAPVPARDHALRACAAALEMRDRVEGLRPAWRERYGVEIRAGAGLNTGPMVAGNIGSRRKTNYTVLGEAVNLASRLEGATKVYGVPILLGDGTRRAAGEGILARSLDVLRVKGKEVGVPVHELLGLAATASAEDRRRVARWEEAVALYRQARFADALGRFEALLAELPQDPPAALYVARCRDFLHNPPAAWDGVHVLHEK